MVEARRSHQAVACKKRYVEEPRKPQRLLIEVMKLAALGHVRVKSLDTAWVRVESWYRERSGRRKPQAQGCVHNA